MFKVEVIADSSGQWAGNGLTFDTREAAEQYARDLACRWTLVREWRVVEIKPSLPPSGVWPLASCLCHKTVWPVYPGHEFYEGQK